MSAAQTTLMEPKAKYIPGLTYSLAFLGEAPLVPGENAKSYAQLLAYVTDMVRPRDVMEAIWVRDYTDEHWDIMRYRRGTAGLIKAAQAKALAEALCPAMTTDVDNPCRAAEQLALRWTKGDQAAIDEVTTLLDPSETTDIALIAPAISLKIDDIERIDRMVRTKEARRDRCLSEIEVHRLSTFLIDRQMTEVVHDAESGYTTFSYSQNVVQDAL